MSDAIVLPPPTALAHRLATVIRTLTGRDTPLPLVDGSLYDVTREAVVAAQVSTGPAAAWLLIVGATAAFPPPSVVRSVQLSLQMQDPDVLVMPLLNKLRTTAESGRANARLRIVSDRPVVDVDRTAKSNFLTGIQRVVRGVASHWNDDRDVELVAWTTGGGAYRTLRPAERSRLVTTHVEAFDPLDTDPTSAEHEILVPWRVPLVLTEVPSTAHSKRLAGVASSGVVSLRLVGYDCIPVSSAEMVPVDEPEKFGQYLEVVKSADRLAGISETAAREFRGFNRSLTAQGLSGPRVSACPLPNTFESAMRTETTDVPVIERPLVVTLGSIGRRKNQVVLVEAAELLWREGLEFELRVIGHIGAERTPLSGLIPELQKQGRHLVIESGVSDAQISAALDQARCSVFTSLHEGYGLPVVESLSAGVPVIASDFGSVREVAEDQGCLLVDPTDVAAVSQALRAVLIDDDLHSRLVNEARSRTPRTWRDYADDLWADLLA